MLSFEENRLNLKTISILSTLCILPVEISVETGEIKRQSRRWKRVLWKIFYLFGVLHWIYIFGRLIQMCIIDRNNMFRWDHFVLHLLVVMAFYMNYFMGHNLFLQRPLEFSMICNSIFIKIPPKAQPEEEENEISSVGDDEDGREVKVVVPADRFVRPVLTLPLQYSLHELFAKGLSLAVFSVPPYLLAYMLRDPTHPQLLYSSFPAKYQTVWSFSLAALFEAWIIEFSLSLNYIAVLVQLQLFDKCQSVFEELESRIKYLRDILQNEMTRIVSEEIEALLQILNETKELVLLIEFCNRVFPFCIFVWKIYCLSAAIFGSFFFIRHSTDHPFLAGFMTYVVTTVTLAYAFLYEKVHIIPEKMERLKVGILLAARKIPIYRKNQGMNIYDEVKREVKGFQNVAIRVGSFHTIERTSTLDFIHFFVQQVVSLLVSFPA